LCHSCSSLQQMPAHYPNTMIIKHYPMLLPPFKTREQNAWLFAALKSGGLGFGRNFSKKTNLLCFRIPGLAKAVLQGHDEGTKCLNHINITPTSPWWASPPGKLTGPGHVASRQSGQIILVFFLKPRVVGKERVGFFSRGITTARPIAVRRLAFKKSDYDNDPGPH